LFARHGRPGKCGGSCSAITEARRLVDDYRADGGRQARRQSEPGRPDLLRRFDHGVRPDFAVTGSGRRTWRASRRGQIARGHRGRRLPQGPARRRDAIQYDPRGATITREDQPRRTIMFREAFMLAKRSWALLALLLTAPISAATGNVITDWDEKAIAAV